MCFTTDSHSSNILLPGCPLLLMCTAHLLVCCFITVLFGANSYWLVASSGESKRRRPMSPLSWSVVTAIGGIGLQFPYVETKKYFDTTNSPRLDVEVSRISWSCVLLKIKLLKLLQSRVTSYFATGQRNTKYFSSKPSLRLMFKTWLSGSCHTK